MSKTDPATPIRTAAALTPPPDSYQYRCQRVGVPTIPTTTREPAPAKVNTGTRAAVRTARQRLESQSTTGRPGAAGAVGAAASPAGAAAGAAPSTTTQAEPSASPRLTAAQVCWPSATSGTSEWT